MITCHMLIIEFILLFASLQENIVYHPHLKSNYNQVCMVKQEAPEQKPSKLSQLFQLFSLGNDGKQTHKDEL